MARAAPAALLDADGREVRVVAPAAGAALPPPAVWRTTLWRRLAAEAPGVPLEVVVAPGERAEVAAWLAHRRAWAAARARPPGEVRDPWMRAALLLAEREPALAALIPASRAPRIRPRHPSTFASLGRAIAYQQLSGKAAATIWGRVCARFEGGVPEAAALLRMRVPTLRACGLSAAKALAIRDLAAHVVRGDLEPERLAGLPDDEVVERLTAVRGIGPWSAHMHLLFALQRPDVWPTGDLGVQKGVARIRGLARVPTPKALEALGEAWRPHRSLVAWYAWRALEIGFP